MPNILISWAQFSVGEFPVEAVLLLSGTMCKYRCPKCSWLRTEYNVGGRAAKRIRGDGVKSTLEARQKTSQNPQKTSQKVLGAFTNILETELHISNHSLILFLWYFGSSKLEPVENSIFAPLHSGRLWSNVDSLYSLLYYCQCSWHFSGATASPLSSFVWPTRSVTIRG